jgi:hypothetical protein
VYIASSAARSSTFFRLKRRYALDQRRNLTGGACKAPGPDAAGA